MARTAAVIRVVLQRSFRRARQHLRMAMARSPNSPAASWPRPMRSCLTHWRKTSELSPSSRATSATVRSEERSSATASRLNSSV